jgi:hypothetical protein
VRERDGNRGVGRRARGPDGRSFRGRCEAPHGLPRDRSRAGRGGRGAPTKAAILAEVCRNRTAELIGALSVVSPGQVRIRRRP